jgi:hypothetical protein
LGRGFDARGLFSFVLGECCDLSLWKYALTLLLCVKAVVDSSRNYDLTRGINGFFRGLSKVRKLDRKHY